MTHAKLATLALVFAASAAAPTVARATDVVSQWNDLFLDAIHQNGGGPLGAARSGAIMHGAIYDAVNSIAGTHTQLITKAAVTAPASESAAVAAAGRATMSALYGHLPGMQARIDGLYTSQLNSLPSGTRRTAGVQIGQWVATTVLANRANDGFNNPTTYTPGTNPGDWQGNYNPGGNAVGPHWGSVRPFAMTSGSQFRPNGAPHMDTAEYAAACSEVKSLAAADSTTRTARQTKSKGLYRRHHRSFPTSAHSS